jgi:predicted nucleotidyltransferase
MSHHVNLVRIRGVYHALAELKETVVFVGGATVSLYADKPEQTDVRPTNDIDVLLEIASYNEFAKLQEKLSAIGFNVDPDAKIICRYKYEGLIVDIMPTDESVLGFTNKWYKVGFSKTVTYPIDDQTVVNIFTPPYFVASKFEAFNGRGKNDGRTSRDFEDIVYVLDNRKSIWQELRDCDQELLAYLKEQSACLLENKHIEEWISAHIEPKTAAHRARIILDELRKLVV